MHDSSQRRMPRRTSRGCWRGQVSNTQFGKQRTLISTARTTCACQLAGICEELPTPRTLSYAHTHTHTHLVASIMRRQIAYIFGSSLGIDVDVQQTHSRHILPHSNLFLYLYTIDVSVKVYYVALIVRCVSLQEAAWWQRDSRKIYKRCRRCCCCWASPVLMLPTTNCRKLTTNSLYIHTHTCLLTHTHTLTLPN